MQTRAATRGVSGVQKAMFDVDRSAKCVANWVAAIEKGTITNVEECFEKREFWLFAAICVEKSGVLGLSPKERLHKLGSKVLEMLKDEQQISKALRAAEGVSKKIYSFPSQKRSKPIKEAIERGKACFSRAQEKLKEHCVQIETIENCPNIECGRVYVWGLRNVFKNSNLAAGVFQFPEAYDVEWEIWTYWSCYDACINRLSKHGAKVDKTMNASRSITECISAFTSLQTWAQSQFATSSEENLRNAKPVDSKPSESARLALDKRDPVLEDHQRRQAGLKRTIEEYDCIYKKQVRITKTFLEDKERLIEEVEREKRAKKTAQRLQAELAEQLTRERSSDRTEPSAKVISLEKSLKEKDEIIEKRTADIKMLLSKVAKVQKQLDELVCQRDRERKDAVRQIKEVQERQEAEKASLAKNVERENSDQKELSAQLIALQKTLKEKKESIDLQNRQNEEELERLNGKLKEIRKDRDDLESHLREEKQRRLRDSEDAVREKLSVEQRLEALADQLERETNDKKDLSAELIALRETLKEKEETIELQKQNDADSERLRGEVRKFEMDRDDLTFQLRNLQAEMASFADQLERENSEKKELSAELVALQKTVKEKEKTIELHKQNDADSERSRGELKKLEMNCDELTFKLRNQQAEIASFADQLERENSEKKELSALLIALQKTLREKEESLEQQNKQNEAEFERLNGKLKKIGTDRDDLESQLREEKQGRLSDNEDAVREKLSVEQRLEALADQLETERSDKTKLSAQFIALQKTLEEKEEAIELQQKKSDADSERLHGEMRKLEMDRDELTFQLRNLQAEIASFADQLERENSEKKELSAELIALQKTVTAKEETIELQQKQHEEDSEKLRGELRKVRTDRDDLESQLRQEREGRHKERQDVVRERSNAVQSFEKQVMELKERHQIESNQLKAANREAKLELYEDSRKEVEDPTECTKQAPGVTERFFPVEGRQEMASSEGDVVYHKKSSLSPLRKRKEVEVKEVQAEQENNTLRNRRDLASSQEYDSAESQHCTNQNELQQNENVKCRLVRREDNLVVPRDQDQAAISQRRLPRDKEKQELAQNEVAEIGFQQRNDKNTGGRLSFFMTFSGICYVIIAIACLSGCFVYLYPKVQFSNPKTPSLVSIYTATWTNFSRIVCESGFHKWEDIGNRLGYNWETLEEIREGGRGRTKFCHSLLQKNREKRGDSRKVRDEIINACDLVEVGGRLQEIATENGYYLD